MPFTEMEKMEGIDLEVRESEEEELVLLHLGDFNTMCIELYRGDIRFLLSTQLYLGGLLQLLKIFVCGRSICSLFTSAAAESHHRVLTTVQLACVLPDFPLRILDVCSLTKDTVLCLMSSDITS